MLLYVDTCDVNRFNELDKENITEFLYTFQRRTNPIRE